jgi:hypothetical protein
MAFIPQIREQAEVIFSARQGKEDFVEYEFKDYKGQLYHHLFAQEDQLAGEFYRNCPWLCLSAELGRTGSQRGLRKGFGADHRVV